ncbi:MAG: AmmeMemoRadiSam system protein B, partial [Deltaproteobacteria bacterium]|nr:AmmeMemoRadiSam system protein B [Deltaproteobacteria bacterium]
GPVVAGQFYTDKPEKLGAEIDGYLRDAIIAEPGGEVFGLVSPHAGYMYSGPCAAHGFKAVAGKSYDIVVVIGLSHRVPGTLSVLDADAYRTPLGEVKIDRDRSRQLIDALPFASDDPSLFSFEHSVEVQLPFLQRVLPPFRAVLISMRSTAGKVVTGLAAALDEIFRDDRVLYVASSDLSHFHAYDVANRMDRETLAMVEALDVRRLEQECESGAHEMCGVGPVLTLLHLYRRRGGNQATTLCYMNSGDTSGDMGRVVGYGSVALWAPKPTDVRDDDTLSSNEREALLALARETLNRNVGQSVGRAKMPDIAPKRLERPGAAFVTLHKNGDLRGCIGRIQAVGSLWECVRDMAVAAATEDPRFDPVRPDEIDDLHIEISVLTTPRDADGPGDIVPGRDGLIVEKGVYRGLLLPQVAERYGWAAEEFLDNTCLKAGMSKNEWRRGGVRIQTFQAIVFAEKT